MESVISPLSRLQRLSGFPYPLDEIGLMVNHFTPHRNHLINRCFVCFSFNKEKYNTPEADLMPSFSVIMPGSILNTVTAVRHDELFFSYSAEVSEKLKTVFDPVPPERKRFHFLQDEKFERSCHEIRMLLTKRTELGVIDKLDVLALNMTLSTIADADKTAGAETKPLDAKIKLDKIAQKLQSGARLENLIHQYGYSRRRFYYEWSRFFSVSPKQMQLESKLEKAQSLLQNSTLSIMEIAQTCGFSSHRYFHECFQRHCLCTPGDYRRRFHASDTAQEPG